MSVLPPCQTTMIGSMPHRTAPEALAALDQYPLMIPAWPQLSQRSILEGMVAQCSEGLPGLHVDREQKRMWVQNDEDLPQHMAVFYEHFITENIDALAISPDYAAGLHAFLQKSLYGDEKLPWIKGQVTGPFTLGLGLTDQNKKAVWFDDQYRDIVLKGLGMKAQWQIRALQQRGRQVLLFLDEPILSALGTPAYMGISHDQVVTGLNAVIHAAQAAGARVGIHCCGNMDWGLLASTDVDIIAFDAYAYGEKVALYPDAINAFLQRGGTLAYGNPARKPRVARTTTPAFISDL